MLGGGRFVLRTLSSFAVILLQVRGSWLLFFNCVLAFQSPRFPWLVCSLSLWHFLVILTWIVIVFASLITVVYSIFDYMHSTGPRTSPTANAGVATSIPARCHTFVEIDHKLISTAILLLPLILFSLHLSQPIRFSFLALMPLINMINVLLANIDV